MNRLDRPAPERQKMILECTRNWQVGDREFEWPNNMISTRAIVYESGAIARKGSRDSCTYDADELKLCKKLAHGAYVGNKGLHFDIGSESVNPIWEFYVAADADAAPRKRITSAFIRSRFGETIFPGATVTVERLEETGVWWSEVIRSAGPMTGLELDEYLIEFRKMIDWFTNQPEFIATAFVRIGDRSLLADLSDEQLPAGTVMSPSVHPRLAVGLTRKGSLAGLFGYTVQT